jgi:ABC-type ATPase involved in cell division
MLWRRILRTLSVQESVEEIVQRGHAYISGPAGHGKSHLIKLNLMNRLTTRFRKKGIAMSAMTRLAAKKLKGKHFKPGPGWAWTREGAGGEDVAVG